jgi:concanavalin A-like lectin/glucanase superfamily protein/fibronectin type III domain protein
MPLRRVLFLLCLLSLLGASMASAGGDDRRAPKAVADLEVQHATRTTLAIGWEPARENRNTRLEYEVLLNGSRVARTDKTRILLRGLLCGRSYVIAVRARGAAGTVSPLSTIRAKTSWCRWGWDDGQALLPVAGLKLTSATRTTLAVEWRAATDDDDDGGHHWGPRLPVTYDLFLDGSPAGNTTSTHATLSGMRCETSHLIGVRARDASGNLSVLSLIRAATAACDRTPPSKPAGLTLVGVVETAFTVAWLPSTDDDAVAGYDVSFESASVGTTKETSREFTGLSCGRSYRVEIVAVDPSGNRSAPGEIVGTAAPCPAVGLSVAPAGKDTLEGWKYIAATFDGNAVLLYVDGLEVGRSEISGSMTPSDGALRIGGNNIYAEWFAGVLDEVRLFQRPLSPEEIRAEMGSAAPLAAGLAAAYSFDEGAGSAAGDSSANANRGVIEGATWTADGKFGGALAFDGSDDMVSVADADSLDFTNGMTIGAWVKAKSPTGWQTVVTKEEGSKEQVYGLWASTDAKVPGAHVFVEAKYYEARGLLPLGLNDCRAIPCASLGAAFLSARRGDVVEVAGGTYPGDQIIPAHPGKAGDGVVLFRPAPGATVTLAGELMVDASHVEFRDMHAASGWQARKGADDVTFRDISAAHLFIFSASNVRVLGGEVGPGEGLDYDSIISSAPDGGSAPTDILIQGVWFHDWWRPAGSDFHTECLQVGAAVNLTITGNRFQRCATHDIFVRSWGDVDGSDHPLLNVVIENNFLDATLDGFFTLSAENDLGTSRGSLFVRNNSSLQAMNLDGEKADITVDGNILAFQQSFGCTATIYRYNVIEAGDPCDATDLVAPVAYLDRSALDLHLALGSAAIDRGNPSSFPSVDLDGDARPVGGAPDAGADERR